MNDESAASSRQYHIGLGPGEVAPFVMLVGDPARAKRVSELFDRIEHEKAHREYITYTGTHRGLPLSVMGTGMGADNTEIAVVELSQIAPQLTLIRCGSSGGLQPEIKLGELVVAQAAYRLENTSTQFVGEGYPAVASTEVVLALIQAAEELGHRHHVGFTATASGFYAAQARRVGAFTPRYPDLIAELQRQGIKNMEMETSCLLTLASLAGLRAGAVCAVYAERAGASFINAEEMHAAELRCVEVGLAAFHNLRLMDKQRGSNARWHPGLT